MNRYGVLHEIPAERALDVAIAEALGWKWQSFRNGDGRRLCALLRKSSKPWGMDIDRDTALALGLFSDWHRELPRFNSHEGFWLLVDELGTRGLNFCVGTGVGNDPAYARVGPPDWVAQSVKHTHVAFGETQYDVETALARAFIAAITDSNNEARSGNKNRQPGSENGQNDPA